MCISHCAVFDQNFRSLSPKKWLFKEIFCLILLVSLSFITASKFTPASSACEAITMNNNQFEIDSPHTLSTMFTFDPKGSGYEIYFDQWEPTLHFQSHDRSVSSEKNVYFYIAFQEKVKVQPINVL